MGAPYQSYTPTNAHEVARRKVWSDVYVVEFTAKGSTFGPAPDVRATRAADAALKEFDVRFSGAAR